MPVARFLPATGEVFLDARGSDRALRATWHFDADLLILSFWHGNVCTGSFRMPADQVPELIELLESGCKTARVVADTRRHRVG